jgi:DNA-directed RNA polymerase specialized sigma24 family protein
MPERAGGGHADHDTAHPTYRGIPEADAAALVRRYQQGEREALAYLHEELRPAILAGLRHYRATDLPPSVTLQDLQQQSWIILADLAARWKPGGSFLAYFFQSFPHQINRFVQRAFTSRRTRAVQVMTLPHDDLLLRMEHLADQRASTDASLVVDSLPSTVLTTMLTALLLDASSAATQPTELRSAADGHATTAVPTDLVPDVMAGILSELVALPALQRAAFLLRVLEGHDFATIGRTLQISRSSAHRCYHQALARLRSPESSVGREVARHLCPQGVSPGATDGASQLPLTRLVHMLHRTAGPHGELAGRRRVVEATGLNRREYTTLMTHLEAAGAIVERAPTRAGRLVERTPEATLARLEGRAAPILP